MNQPEAARRNEAARAAAGGTASPSRERLRSTEERLLAAADAAQAAEKAAAQGPGKRGAAAPRGEAKGVRRAVEIDEEGHAIGRAAPARTGSARATKDASAERITKRPRVAKFAVGSRVAKAATDDATTAATDEGSPVAKPATSEGSRVAKAATDEGSQTAKAATSEGAPRAARAAKAATSEGAPRAARAPRAAANDGAARAAAGGAAVRAAKPAKAAARGAAKAATPTPGVTREVRGWGESGPAPRKPAAPRKSTLPKRTGPERLAPAKVRLQKVLASAGVAARRKAEELITRRRVTVNGKVASELGVKVDPDRDEIKVDGKIVQVEKKVYFVLNKPDGVVCSAEGLKDAEGRPTVLSLMQAVTQRIYPVGRLDFHSRGALILTNDGDLAAALTHPRHEVAKTYHVKFQGRLDEAALAALGQGIALEDGTVTRPAEEVSVIKETATNTWAQITIRQGLNRQIRRMGDALGHPVLKLIRVSVGQVTADGLDDGEFRPLTPTEVYDLMAAALK
ncbi:MAG: rRNA pseudouridine synthase [Myxococcales bacterium]|nr:rRNA pseudouridine synthase [Myxococcales bacterium]